jgi:hypothetical protein
MYKFSREKTKHTFFENGWVEIREYGPSAHCEDILFHGEEAQADFILTVTLSHRYIE